MYAPFESDFVTLGQQTQSKNNANLQIIQATREYWYKRDPRIYGPCVCLKIVKIWKTGRDCYVPRRLPAITIVLNARVSIHNLFLAASAYLYVLIAQTF